MNDKAIEFGTDNGPRCAACESSNVWMYRLWPDVNSYAVAICAGCHARAHIEWSTRIAAPENAIAMRSLHEDSVRRGFAYPCKVVRS